MPSLSDLPAELIMSICGSLDHADIVLLRHTSRILATGSADGVRDASLDSTAVTCSKAGLERLEFLTTTNASAFINIPERVSQIKHVTIHILAPSRLKELADACDDGQETPYLLAYGKVRITLINALNRLPNLESITVTNETFKGFTEPPFENNDPGFDPIREHDSKVNGDRLAPRCYGFESALSVVSNSHQYYSTAPRLNSSPELHLVVDYANVDPALARLPELPNPLSGEQVLSAYVAPLSVAYQLRPINSTRNKKGLKGLLRTLNCPQGWPHMDAIQTAMFGVSGLNVDNILGAHLNHITLRGQDGARYGALSQLTRLTRPIVGVFHSAPKVLSITLEDAPEAYGMLKQYSKFDHLATLRLTDTELSKSMADYLQLRTTLTSVILTRCSAPISAWETIIPALARASSNTLMQIHLKYCVNTYFETTFDFQWNRVPNEKIVDPAPPAPLVRSTDERAQRLVLETFLPLLEWVSTQRIDADREVEAIAEQQAIQKQFMAMKV